MLHLLSQYAERHELIAEPGFESEEIRWCIVLNRQGRFLELVDFDPQGKRGRRCRTVPKHDANIMQGGGKSHFLARRPMWSLCISRKS
ncbi:MAG: type I-C CRISPR-associated protein Cas8c/Csd1 [bacterium]|jgi:hypothetical protein